MLDLYSALDVLTNNKKAIAPDILSYAPDSSWWINSLEQLMDGRKKTKAEQRFFQLVKDENIFNHFIVEKDPVGYCLDLLKKLKIDDFESDLTQLLLHACHCICYFHIPLRKDYLPLELGFDLTIEEIKKFRAECEKGLKTYFVDKNYAKAFKLFQEKPKNPVSQFIMAHVYENGLNDIKVDSIKARKLYEESAEQGFVPALTKKAEFYLFGIGGEMKRDSAFELLKQAVKFGNPLAFTFLSGVYKSLGKKREAYKIASEGIKHGSYRCYALIIKTSPIKDNEKLTPFLKKGIESGDPMCILPNIEADKTSPKANLRLLKKLLKENLNYNERGLAELYSAEICLNLFDQTQDKKYYNLMKYYLEEGMKDKDEDCFLFYGDYFTRGKESNELYLKGAYCDSGECAGIMAKNYFHGIDIEQDYARAAFWAEAAIDDYSFEGAIIKSQLMLLGKCYKKDVKEATYILKKLDELGSDDASYLLGNLYLSKAIPGGNSQAFKYFENGYKKGNDSCAFEYAKMNLRKMVKNADPKKGYEILFDLANTGDGPAQMELAMCLIFGKFLAKDEKLGQKYLEMAKNNTENPSVQKSVEAFLGLSYYYGGNGVEQDDDKAMEYLQKAYDSGNLFVCQELGTLYFVKGNYEKARKYFEQGEEFGIPDCLYALGQTYFEGYGVTKDLKKAEEYFKKAIACGVKDAYYWLARVYMEQDLKKTDGKRIISLLKEACKYKIPEALNSLGYEYQEGPYIKKHDMKKAISLYKEASEYGLQSAQFNLGSYLLTQNDPKLREEGFQWMYQLAKKGDAYAMLSLIGCYIFSDDENKKDLAFEWIEKADKLLPNHPFINFYYGYCYMFGYGVMMDQNKAVEYLKKSAYLDDPFSCFLLGQSYRYASEITHDPDLYFLWVKKAYELNPNASISTELGRAYEEGYGTKQDFDKAKECFLSGLKMGSITSYEHLSRLYGGKLPKDIQEKWNKIPKEEKVDDKVGIDAIDVFNQKEKKD